jgi:hypothetical protein
MKLLSLKKAITISGFTEEKIATWYTSKSVREIASIFKIIDDLSSKLKSEVESQHLVKMTLSDCLRNVSVQRDAEWKLYREEGWRKGLKDGSLYIPLIPLFQKKLESNLRSLKEYVEKLKISEKSSNSTYEIFKNDCAISIENVSKNNQKFDLVVTSPPYGDSPTTVAYEQFSWLPNTWLGLDNRPPGKLAKEMLGGILSKEINILGCKVIDSAIKRMKDNNIAIKNYSFYRDYLNSIINVAKVVRTGGYICYVVGNRISGKQYMRLDLFTRWAFEQNGFSRVGKIKKRRIPNTRMPKSNPSGSTMNHEYIVICRKN